MPRWTRTEDNTYTQAWLQQHRPAETLQHFQTVSIDLHTLAIGRPPFYLQNAWNPPPVIARSEGVRRNSI